ncbi:MAG: SIR2 family protein [Acidobacteria bacterium]|nr:SIR2 family protein [Acidobacteriota bacterium]
MEFQDKIHVEHIRKEMWAGREYGRVAVMVGAGFSLNAEKVRETTNSFPTWKTLVEKVYDRLYPNEPGKRAESVAGDGALKIASEYEQNFGRSNLERLIIESLPDRDFSPGNLHKLLMNLPWSDVFTTNYDTLLEGASRLIPDPRYDVVYTSADLPGSLKPRIVKLHGSLPSTRPFILTEEDFRTYPTKFAPFVNTVQQSMMENTFCLIGFSGADPNFQHWSGWVRDHLGKNSLKIYLCGFFEGSTSQRRALESKNIIPIDLSPMVNKGTPNRHAAALKWFLEYLKDGETKKK